MMDRNTMNETFKAHGLKWRTAEDHFGINAIDEGFHPRDWILVDTNEKVVALGDSKHNTASGLPTPEEVYEKLATAKTKEAEPVKPETKPEPKTETDETEESNPVLDWFDNKDKSRYKKHDERVDSIPETAVALDSSSRRYAIERGTVIRYRSLKSNTTGETFCRRENFGNAAFAAPEVRAALEGK